MQWARRRAWRADAGLVLQQRRRRAEGRETNEVHEGLANNWQIDGLNNFRQNTQGTLGKLNIADLTVELGLDDKLIAALAEGLPPSAGIARGFARLVMLATGATRIDDGLTFTAAEL